MTYAFRPLAGLICSMGLLLSLSGCIVDEGCGPSNCTGCCSSSGQCMAGTLQNECGSGGAACDVCIATQACIAGRCQLGSGSGGGTGTGGGGGTTDPRLVCNTSGVATGCTVDNAFSCELATKCYQTLDGCRNSGECGSTGTGGGGGGGGTATGGGSGTGGGGSSTGSRTVTGLATYDYVPSRYVEGQGGTLYFNSVTRRPIRNATVRVVENGTTVIGNAVTGEDGRYSISFNPGTGPLQVQVLARSQVPAIQVEDNTAGNATWGFGAALNAGVTTLDLNATHGWTGSGYGSERRAAPFAILDSMYTAAKAFTAIRSVNFPALKVNWSPNNAPQGGNTAAGQIGTSHFNPSENEIYVLGLAGADTDEFDSHVIVHEWGHYFEENISRSDSPGGPHGSGDVLDPRIAFGEAWGTAVAAMVLPETMYTDSVWRNGSLMAWGYDAETPAPGDDPSPNVFSEYAVLRAIHDLYDSAADGSHDQVGVGLGAVYDVMTGHQVQTDAVTSIGSFVTGLKALPGANASGINAVLANFGMGAITSDFGAGDANLTDMFTNASVPYNGGVGLIGGYNSNTYQQNQYFVFTGPGRTVTVTAGHAQYDVGVAVYRRGQFVGGSDQTTAGNESYSFNAASGTTYVVVVTGYNGPSMATYQVTVTIQ